MKRIVLLISMLVMTQVFSQQLIKDLTVNKFKVVNTKMGSNPCPLMSELDRDAIASPTDGQCIYNTTSKKLNIYNDLALVWKAAGGGVDAWATGFAYSADDLVIESDKIYKALIAHTSGVFATDFASGDWVEISAGITSSGTVNDNRIVRYDGTTGKLAKNSGVTVSDTADLAGVKDISASGDITLTGTQFNSVKVGEQMARAMTTGVIDGSLLSINADPTKFNISAQVLTFSDYSSSLTNPVVKVINCPSLSAISVTNLATADSTYVSVDPTCAIAQSTTFPTPVQRRTNAFVGRLSHINRTSVTAVASLTDLVTDTNSQFYDLLDSIGAFNISGNVVTPNGANLSFDRSAGSIFRRSANYPNNKQSPHVITLAGATASNFLRSTQNSTNATPVNTIDVANYDVGGTVTAIPGIGGTSTNRRAYIFSTGRIAIQYGQVTYSSLANAIAGFTTESFVVNPQLAEGGILLAVISCRKDATALNNSSQCKISPVGRFDQTGVTVGSLATTTLQQAYNNSATPQITTSTANGSLDIKRGSAADTDSVLRIQNGAGLAVVDIKGNGEIKIENKITSDTVARDNNLLVNPSFEYATFNQGWTCSLGTASVETTSLVDGVKALGIVSAGAGVRCYQLSTTNAAGLKGTLIQARARVKTTDLIMKVCGLVDGNGAANERNCVDVSPTTTDNVFYSAQTQPFQAGGTSNGIVIYTTTTTTQPTVIDATHVGVVNGTLASFSNTTGWSDCGLTAADFTGFGTPTVIQLQCKRDETDLLIRGKFTSGTSTAVEARMNLKFNGASLVSAGVTSIPSIQKTGEFAYSISSAAYGTTLIEKGVSYATFGAQSNTQAGLLKINANAMAASGIIVTLNSRVPIAGWEANTNAAIAGCVDAFGCTNEVSAQVSAAGVVSGENVDWINGNCTIANTSQFTCNFNTSAFTVAPNCTASVVTAVTNVQDLVSFNTVSSTNFIANTYGNSGTNVVKPFTVTCQKTGADFKPKTVVVSPLQGYVKVPGAENLTVENFTVSYGATATTPCAVNGACAYKDELGTNAVLNTTRTGAGAYTLNTVATYSKLKCRYPLVTTGGYTIVYSANNLSCSNCSSVSFTTAVYNTGVSTDSYGTLDCTGVR